MRPVYFGHFSDKTKLLKMRFSFVFLSILKVINGQQDISCAQCIEFLTESGENFGSDVGKCREVLDSRTKLFKASPNFRL